MEGRWKTIPEEQTTPIRRFRHINSNFISFCRYSAPAWTDHRTATVIDIHLPTRPLDLIHLNTQSGWGRFLYYNRTMRQPHWRTVTTSYKQFPHRPLSNSLLSSLPPAVSISVATNLHFLPANHTASNRRTTFGGLQQITEPFYIQMLRVCPQALANAFWERPLASAQLGPAQWRFIDDYLESFI